LVDAQNRLKKFVALTDAHRYVEAKPGLMQLRQWLVDMTEAHIGLYKTLNQIPSARAQAELEKTLALEFAQLRDRAMVEMAKIHIADKDYTKAVKELTDVVKSQPKSKVGLRSYEMLQEIGFTEKLQLAQ
jgi:lipopolysaccharide biosynthesis regulator YciM